MRSTGQQVGGRQRAAAVQEPWGVSLARLSYTWHSHPQPCCAPQPLGSHAELGRLGQGVGDGQLYEVVVP